MSDHAGPKRIGRYDVERLLGQGGMGRVWLARDTVLGRPVAIKVLRDDLALPPTARDELLVRMGHEARAAAAVSHPNIVTLHDMGEDPVVGLFLVFEYVTASSAKKGVDEASEPLSLRDRLKEGPLPFGEVAKLARELGSALSFAHEAGVIHRDVKPENVLFSRTGFKIADFGIARIPDSTITRANTVLGTPAYTAPEALSKGDFGPASDQFSLAATLYEAATGVRAFAADDAIATAGKVSSEPPPPLDDAIGPEPTVKALDIALQRGLAKTPEARFPSCADLGQEIARIIENEGRRTASGRAGPLLSPIPELLELERTPLSSRTAHVAMVERAISEQVATGTLSGTGETPRPSLFVRKQTQRFQNIAAGAAVLVILVLVLIGRRSPPATEDTGPLGSATIVASPASIAPSASARVHPRPPPKASASPPRASATSLIEDAGPSPSPSPSAVERDD